MAILGSVHLLHKHVRGGVGCSPEKLTFAYLNRGNPGPQSGNPGPELKVENIKMNHCMNVWVPFNVF